MENLIKKILSLELRVLSKEEIQQLYNDGSGIGILCPFVDTLPPAVAVANKGREARIKNIQEMRRATRRSARKTQNDTTKTN